MMQDCRRLSLMACTSYHMPAGRKRSVVFSTLLVQGGLS